ncbi:MAG TPA: S66 peptidase family protein [Candidatus Andersenbacteria bacterium]|nr:S66 peptidase family protein [Candidatus Andersenbacteria bacterium]
MNTIKPPKLHQGDKVGICCPSGTIDHKRELFDRAKNGFQKATELQVHVAPNAYAKHYYSAGTVQERLDDFHALIADPTIKTIIFGAGGDTASDLLPYLNYELIKNNPKIISGISDATTLLTAITAKTGLVTFLGLEILDYADYKMNYTTQAMQNAWFDGGPQTIQPNPNWKELKENFTRYTGWQTIREGVATGQLFGGNSESYIQLLNTPYELRIPQGILFLETYKLPKKQIHKTLIQLQLRGILDDIAGLIVGYCLESDKQEIVGNDQLIQETILEVTSEYSFPIMQIGEIGHCVENFMQPIGAHAKMDATALQFEITESVTT